MNWPLIIPKEKFLSYIAEVTDTTKKLRELGWKVKYIPRSVLESMPDDFRDTDSSLELEDVCQVYFQGTPKGWEELAADVQSNPKDEQRERNH